MDAYHQRTNFVRLTGNDHEDIDKVHLASSYHININIPPPLEKKKKMEWSLWFSHSSSFLPWTFLEVGCFLP